MKWLDTLSKSLLEREEQQATRHRLNIQQARAARHVKIAHQAYCNFGSNDYLGLSNHPRLIETLRTEARHGVGSAASPLVIGYRQSHAEFEKEAAEFVGCEKAILFNSGFTANLGLMTTLLKPTDIVYADELVHASIIDGCRLSRARFKRFNHNDVAHLEKLLADQDPDKRAVIVTEALFSMDGDIAPVAELLKLAERYDTLLIIDESHSFGIYGPNGKGLVAQEKLRSDRIVLVVPLGKSAGIAGAFIAGHPVIIETLVQFARPYIYSTAMPFSMAEALRISLKLIESAGQQRQQLQENIDYFSSAKAHLISPIHHPQSPIIPCIIGDNQNVIDISDQLKNLGCLVPAIRPPTVPNHEARLRISITASHSKGDIERLCHALSKVEPAIPKEA